MPNALSIPLLALVPLALHAAQTPAPGQKPAPATPAAPAPSLRPYVLGAQVEGELTLPDLAGKSHALFAENPGKALVLVFWSHRCPVSRAYVAPLTELARAHEK